MIKLDVTRKPTPDEFDTAILFVGDLALIEHQDPNPGIFGCIQALLQIIAYAMEKVEDEKKSGKR